MPEKVSPLIYLDHNATTPVDPAAIKTMVHFMREEYGNPSSSYPLGSRAKDGVEKARNQVASLIGCMSSEIIFTSGGSESNNMALKGVIDFRNPGDHHIITSSVEHPAILNPLQYLMELGVDVTILKVDARGRIDPAQIRMSIKSNTKLISVMLANNETGTLQPLREIASIAKDYDIPIHTDAAQAVGKIPVDVNDLDVDLLSVAGHKLYGPKGIGVLYIRDGLRLTQLIHGAGQEMDKRAGTENVILATGLGTACKVAVERLQDDITGIRSLRDRFQDMLFFGIENLVLNGHPEDRLPNTLNVSVPGIEGDRILDGLTEIAASTGAACHDKSVRLSHVLNAMAVPPEIGMGALRFSLGRSNREDQIDKAAELIIKRVKSIINNK